MDSPGKLNRELLVIEQKTMLLGECYKLLKILTLNPRILQFLPSMPAPYSQSRKLMTLKPALLMLSRPKTSTSTGKPIPAQSATKATAVPATPLQQSIPSPPTWPSTSTTSSINSQFNKSSTAPIKISPSDAGEDIQRDHLLIYKLMESCRKIAILTFLERKDHSPTPNSSEKTPANAPTAPSS